MNIGIVTDSTCDLGDHIIKEYQIEIVPLTVHFDTTKFTDGVEINSQQFFDKIKTTSIIPKTSKPSKQAFLDKYKEMLNDYDKIISIHVSKALSSTYQSAKLAAQDLKDHEIKVIDSASISLGLGFQVLLAAKLVSNNYPIENILNKIDKAREKTNCIFTVEDLTYMKEGGRIGKARALLGAIFNINPIIEISSVTGEVNPLDKVRGNKKTLNKMSEMIINKINKDQKAWIGIMHGDRVKSAEKLLNKTKKMFPDDIDTTFFKGRISPTLGCHVGPSVYAFATLSGEVLDI